VIHVGQVRKYRKITMLNIRKELSTSIPHINHVQPGNIIHTVCMKCSGCYIRECSLNLSVHRPLASSGSTTVTLSNMPICKASH